MKLYDMHTHTEHSHDSQCPMPDMAYSQLAAGASGFAVTEHCDCLKYEKNNLAKALTASHQETRMLHTQFHSSIEILSGMEIGEGFLRPDIQNQALSLCEYDVVIGSVHYVHDPDGFSGYCADTDFTPFSTSQLDRFLNSYLDNILCMLESTPCDIMAHLTYPLRYINGKYGKKADFRIYSNKVRSILQYIIAHDIALEVNTSGLGTTYNACFPDAGVLALYRDLGGRLVTLGSDAHIASRAAFGFLQAIDLLKSTGFSQYYYYKKRNPIPCDL